MSVMMGATDEDTVSSLAGRLARSTNHSIPMTRRRIRELAGGMELTQFVANYSAQSMPTTSKRVRWNWRGFHRLRPR